MSKKSVTIHLPALPASWNELTPGQLEGISRLSVRRRLSEEWLGESDANTIFKLNVFLFLLGLRVVGRTQDEEGKETAYLMRRRGWKHLGERIPMKAWQLWQWISSLLGWLDNPLLLTKAPYGEVKVGRKHFLLPGNVLINATFYQYLCAQNLLTVYFGLMKRASPLVGQKKSRKELGELMGRAADIRCRFMACLLNERYVSRTAQVEGTTVQTEAEYIYPFRREQIEANAKRFRRLEPRMFPVLLQHFQSVQEYFSKAYPELYRKGGVKKKTNNPMLEEEGMLNGVMKYQGFSSYDEIYNAPVNKILGVMNNMCKEAMAIEEANARMKRK